MKKQKRLSISIPEELHREIKLLSAGGNLSIKKWVLKAVALYIISQQTRRS